MVKRRVPLLLPALLFPLAGIPAEINFHAVVAPEAHSENRSSPYYVGPPTVEKRRYVSRQDLEIRVREGGLTARGVARWQRTEGLPDDFDWVTAELYYDGELAPGAGWTLGRKVVSWGVGFAFRPLDVIQREDRRRVNPPALVGVPLVALERFSSDSAWTLAWSNPTRGDRGDDRDSEGLALRWYRFSESNDYHGVVRISQRHRLELGAGATVVLGDDWALHGAGLYRRRHAGRTHTLLSSGQLFSPTDPWVESSRENSLDLVAGAQWTGSNGWSLLAEGYYDGSALSAADWQRLNRLTRRQRTQAGNVPAEWIAGNVAWSSRAFAAPNLVRENLLLRASHDGGEGFKPYAELLVAPRDGGLVGTVGMSYERNRHSFSGGLRQMGGAGDSIFANTPEKRVLWVQWRMSI